MNMNTWRFNLIQASRSLQARPGSTAALIAVLTIGVGLTTAMFALADPFLLRSLPYANAGQLVVLRVSLSGRATDLSSADIPTLAEWRSHTELFESVAAFGEQQLIRVQTPQGAAVLRTVPVSENFFDVLGFPFRPVARWLPQQGTSVQALALLPGSKAQTLGAAILGSYLDAGNTGSFNVASVLPDGFLFPHPRASSRPDALTPVGFDQLVAVGGGVQRYATVVARVRPNVDVDQVRSALSAQLRAGSLGVHAERLTDYLVGTLKPLAWGALSAGLLIVWACGANAANLLIVRTAHRAREFATREALGASTNTILGQLLAETAIVSLMVIALSVGTAKIVLVLLGQVIPRQYVALGQPSMGLRAFAFAGLLGLAVSVIGAVPAWFTLRTTTTRALTKAIAGDARLLKWLRIAMTYGQSSVTMILLVGAVLLGRSYILLWSQDSGFSGDVAVASVSYPLQMTPEQIIQDIDTTVIALAANLPSRSAAAIVGPFIDDVGTVGGFAITIAGRTIRHLPKEVTAGYFDTVGARLVAGKGFTGTDRGWSAVVVDEAFVKALWPGRPYSAAVGEPVGLPGRNTGGQVVGVVHDMYDRALDRPPSGTMFRPLTQPLGSLPVNFMLRLNDQQIDFGLLVRRTVSAVNREAVVIDASRIDDRLAGTVRARSFATLMFTCFTVAGIGVTACGIVAVVGFVVARRTREIAIRRALGAVDRHVLAVVGGEATVVAAAGAVTGLLIGHSMSSVLASQLYGIQPGDPVSMIGAVLLMAAVVAVAAMVPARLALRIDPSRALRVD
jgi:predicted permease